MNKSPVVDTDGHILEPVDLWENYLEDKKYKDLAPTFFDDEEGNQHFKIEGVVLTKKEGVNKKNVGMGLGGRNIHKKWDNSLGQQRWEEQEPGGFDPQKRIVDMDSEGVDIVMLYPTVGLRYTALQDPGLAAALCRAYNKWIADYANYNPKRLYPVGTIPLQDPELAVKEMRFVVEKLGFRSVVIRPNPVNGRNMDDPDYNIVWQAAQDLGCVVSVHEGGNVHNNPQIGRDRFDNFAYIHACAHPMEMQMAFMCVAFGGVLERFPKLKMAFLESGGGWVPYWLDRLDEHYEKLGWIIPECKMTPSEYFKRQCLVQVEAGESTTPMVSELVGEDYIAWGSDYPHFDCNWLNAIETVNSLGVSESTTQKILGANTQRFYSL